MRTVTFKSVLEGAATRLGLEPARNLERNQAAALAEYIQDKLERAWELAPWPEWTHAEERQYRADYDNVVAYVVGDEVYYETEEKYYICILNSTGNLPTNATFWSEATDLDMYVARDQAWETNEMGMIWGVYQDDPRGIQRPLSVPWWVSPNGIQVYTSLKKVWVEFGLKVPRFTATEWAAATAYVAGDVIYYPTTGECYLSILAGTNKIPSA